MRLSSFDVVCQMVEAGTGLAIVPRAAAQHWLSLGVIQHRSANRQLGRASPYVMRSKPSIDHAACPQAADLFAGRWFYPPAAALNKRPFQLPFPALRVYLGG